MFLTKTSAVASATVLGSKTVTQSAARLTQSLLTSRTRMRLDGLCWLLAYGQMRASQAQQKILTSVVVALVTHLRTIPCNSIMI